ncbi:hypothetical protein PIB30_005160 [Stylosanthes scabra]|uniref:F-box associated beta-propeller type 1 domain-containing protein n=1 Tax=Stylosanthes scabra TaxID=79078 RepID=A0ABU6R3I1_9FABA|nr:hypothetical protein [Stylosanthes scabra]
MGEGSMKAHGDGVVDRCNLPVLPHEMVAEILLRLPVKSLLQFNPQFAIDHFRQLSSANNPLTSRLVYANKNYFDCRFGFLPLQPLFKNPSTTTPVVTFKMSNFIGSLDILGSCNGLVYLHHLQSNCIYLWNPWTGFGSHWMRIEASSLSYFGFGYDHVHDKYKFVTVDTQALTLIYTFGSNSWNIGPNFPYPTVGLSGYIGKFLNGTGTLNWMAKVKEKNWVILSFDLANETFRQVSLPTLYGGGDNSCDPELQILRNCLCFSIDHRDIIFDVWMMKDYGVWESWTLISRVNLWRHSNSYPLTPLFISENDVLLLMLPDTRLALCKSDVDLFRFLSIDSSSDAHPFPISSSISQNLLARTYFVHHDSLVVPPQ